MKIYLGVWNIKQANHIPRFMYSVRRLLNRKSSVPFSDKDWIMDSGGFSEININGKYSFTENEYLSLVELHQPRVFFNMDYVCEPNAIKKTGLTVKQHQEQTTNNQIKITELIDNYNIKKEFAGCIQGWEVDDYINHIDILKTYGLITQTMGIGSICRRNSSNQILSILQAVKQELKNVKLHGFGVKTELLKNPETYDYLYSCDSMSWSFCGRMETKKRCLNCIYPNAKSCGNCYQYAINYYNNIESINNNVVDNFVNQSNSMFNFK